LRLYDAAQRRLSAADVAEAMPPRTCYICRGGTAVQEQAPEAEVRQALGASGALALGSHLSFAGTEGPIPRRYVTPGGLEAAEVVTGPGGSVG
jgi:hypothetical protein